MLARRISVQLAPSAHVTVEMRGLVSVALTSVGLEIDEWLPIVGEAKAEDWGGQVAQPTLQVIVDQPKHAADDEIAANLSRQVGDALARIRRELPSLPLGLQVWSASRRRWMAFKPEDSPEAIVHGMAAISSALAMEDNALGWDEERGRWLPL